MISSGLTTKCPPWWLPCSFAAGSGWLNMALSTCCTRKRFFLVNQLFLVLSALLVSAILAFCVMLPVWMGWDWVDPFLSLSELPFFFCSTVAVGELAHVLGLFYLDYPAMLGTFIFVTCYVSRHLRRRSA